MEPLTIFRYPFPSRQHSGRLGHAVPIRAGFPMPERLTLSIGSQWIRQPPDQGNRPDGAANDNSELRFPVGQYSVIGYKRLRGLSDAGAAYLYQLVNGSHLPHQSDSSREPLATDLNSVSSQAIFLPLGLCCQSWGIQCRSGLSLSTGSQWIHLPDQSHCSSCCRWR